MGVNKVEINGETKLDLTQDTVTPETLLPGVSAHNAAGDEIAGAAPVVRYDEAQDLTDAQKKQARDNIGAEAALDLQEITADEVQSAWDSYPVIPHNMVLGSTFTFGKYQVESEDPWPIEWEIVHQTDEYQIAQTKQIIDLRCFDAVEPTNTDSGRKNKGNNNWSVSNIKQFLNSDQATWYSAQHQYDAPPDTSENAGEVNTQYQSHKGFLYYFSDEEKALLKDMTLTLANPNVDGGGSYTWTGKVWLPTYTQMSGNQNNSISEGTKFDKYSDSNSRKKTINKYCILYNAFAQMWGVNENNSWTYWLSSAWAPQSDYVLWVSGDFEQESGPQNGYNGIAPCICLPMT